MSFSMEQALAVCTASLNSRKSVQRTAYKLYYSNDGKRYEGHIMGATVKALITEFRASYAQYKYAIITKVNDDKPLRFYNREVSKKFFSMTRGVKK